MRNHPRPVLALLIATLPLGCGDSVSGRPGGGILDAGRADASGFGPDSAEGTDAATADAGARLDASVPEDAATETDAETTPDAGPPNPDLACYQSEEWTCVPVGSSAVYGEHSFTVRAAQNWVNTGLYLRQGETAQIAESGSWSLGPGRRGRIDHGPCEIGDFVARIGLYYKDQNLTCVDGQVEFVANQDGILYVGALPSNDLGETYETRAQAEGARTVTITSTGATVPTVPTHQAATYDYASIDSGWVELAGEHVIFTIPAELAEADRAGLVAALNRLDDVYRLHEELRGARPQWGQRIRFFPDGTNPGYMLAGNPIRMQPGLISTFQPDRITNAGAPVQDAQIWGYVHELGHDFTLVAGAWYYQDRSLESWPNVFSVHAVQRLGIPLHRATALCTAQTVGSYDTWDAWGGLCFLMQFQFRYGWDFYNQFFTALNAVPPSQVPGGQPPWHFVHDLFEQSSGEDVTPIFEAWQVPHP